MNFCLKPILCNRLTHISLIGCQKRFSLLINISNDNKTKDVESKNKRFHKIRTEELKGFDSRFNDTFGNLTPDDYRRRKLLSEELSDDDDKYDSLEIKRGPKMAEIGYQKQLNQLINKKPIQLRKALEVFNKMVSEDRIAPHKCMYSLMINGCAKVGYTRKAFEFFDEMLKYELRPTKQTMTSLFNACAECPFPDYGLEKARYLREWMSLEGLVINTFHYNSMIKAFGKLGDIQTAFQLVNEMVAKGQTPDENTFAMLLISCISNKESGLFTAIEVFRRIMSHRIPVSIFTFNLLLKATKECGIGSEKNLNSIVGRNISRSKSFETQLTRTDSKHFNEISKIQMNVPSVKGTDSKSLVIRTPNFLLNKDTNQSNIIAIQYDLMSKSSNRFLLLGGIEGFIKMMTDFSVTPNIKTLTLITELIDFTLTSEKQLLDLLDRFKIRPDTDFFNILIKKICLEKDLFSAKKVFQIMIGRGLQPNIMTFGVLALGCNRFSFAKQLLEDMDDINIKPNYQIMGPLITKACNSSNFLAINYLIDYMKDKDIKPDPTIVERLKAIKTKFQKIITNYDCNRNTEIGQKFQNQRFRQEFNSFKVNFDEWIGQQKIEEIDHPWQQFQFNHLPNKKGMHSFVKYMKTKIEKRRNRGQEVIEDEFEEDQLYND